MIALLPVIIAAIGLILQIIWHYSRHGVAPRRLWLALEGHMAEINKALDDGQRAPRMLAKLRRNLDILLDKPYKSIAPSNMHSDEFRGFSSAMSLRDRLNQLNLPDVADMGVSHADLEECL